VASCSVSGVVQALESAESQQHRSDSLGLGPAMGLIITIMLVQLLQPAELNIWLKPTQAPTTALGEVATFPANEREIVLLATWPHGASIFSPVPRRSGAKAPPPKNLAHA
jgi:hypothetical protein